MQTTLCQLPVKYIDTDTLINHNDIVYSFNRYFTSENLTHFFNFPQIVRTENFNTGRNVHCKTPGQIIKSSYGGNLVTMPSDSV